MSPINFARTITIDQTFLIQWMVAYKTLIEQTLDRTKERRCRQDSYIVLQNDSDSRKPSTDWDSCYIRAHVVTDGVI